LPPISRGETVTIASRDLNAEACPHLRLFEGITRRRVTWIQVANGPTAMEAPKGAVIEVGKSSRLKRHCQSRLRLAVRQSGDNAASESRIAG
jgi:hypothetical protein